MHVGDGAAGATGDQARGVPHLEGRHHRQLRRAQRRGAGGALETQRVAPLLAPRLRRSDKVKYLRVRPANYQSGWKLHDSDLAENRTVGSPELVFHENGPNLVIWAFKN